LPPAWAAAEEKEITMARVEAEPYEFEFDPATTALLMIDFQRDFVYPGGFGEALGNDTSPLLKALPPAAKVLEACRAAGVFVIHTREGHRADLSDLPPAKKARGRGKITIGDVGPMGRLLVRGEVGHDIVEEVYPIAGEPIVDKPGKGAFYATDLDAILKMKGIQKLVVCGVTTEVCVHTSVREANDRGYDALVLSDGVGSYFPEFQRVALEMIKAQGGIFGWVSDSERFLAGLRSAVPSAAGAAAG
jgi:nicotinamidase-related amidase